MRALLCTHHVKYWSGSELVVVELAEALRARGLEVDLYTPFPTEGFISSDLGHLAQNVLSTPEQVQLGLYDLVYVQHQTLSRVLAVRQNAEAAFGPHRPYFIYNHLSEAEPFEVPGPFVEVDCADLIWTQSPVTQSLYRERYHPRFAAAQCVPNPAPAAFAQAGADPGPAAELTRLLSVSNHLPPELDAAFDLLRQTGIEVTRFGRPEGNRRLMPADLAAHDAIITIGKSVQYAPIGRRPVFCYDHFGGPDWLADDNFIATGDHNFSGQSAPDKLSPEQIAALLRDGYAAARGFAKSLARETLAPYRLEPHVDRLLMAVQAHRAAPAALRVEASGPCDREAVMARWCHEAELYRLVDREYGHARDAGNRMIGLRRRIRALEKERIPQ